ncbi:putative ABC transporter substrate-binding protein [Gordonia hirsuta DSM 44140 = NBRC 16056]|uniref:Putative ABC transporter substrate-binding protein n=1 Tax=Gordonia hirsuta DSM 44140 = NBRC 16056 TaxID=1121927 RepID=L7LAZ0_9ACTN|nr:transporter substrate-binding domain-containing protein [Gordonia hirsuta]GAC58069.1 putative ABC transporter substrate-binding protein [Gordonia hirsuta DSM 44140 = NBRC 16056]
MAEVTAVKRVLLAGTAAILAFGLSACGTTGEQHPTSSATESTTFNSGVLKRRLPAEIRDSGEFRIATEGGFAPMVTLANGRPTGFDVDLMDKIAELVGVNAGYRQVPFSQILDNVATEKVDIGARGIFDTKEREKKVDLVTYLRAGTQWAARSDKQVDPGNACGLRVGAESGTTQFTLELPAKSRACEAISEKPLEIVPFDSEDAAFRALQRGAIEAVSADSPVILYATKKSAGKLVPVGHAFDTMPYALAVQKGSSLGPILQEAIQHLIDTGELHRIAERWGVERGVVHKSTLNGAVS